VVRGGPGRQGTNRSRRGLSAATVTAAALAFIVAGAAHAEKRGDFDGDGRVDLAIGVPLEDIDFGGNQDNAGAVNVLSGAAGGFNPATDGDTLLTQASAGNIPDDQETFGNELAAGDFDGDGRSDLAVGVPSDTISGQNSAGSVNVFYGSDTGIDGGDPAQLFHQDTTGVAEEAEPFDWFGIEVTSGDFNGDGFDDLAICAVQEDVATNLTDGAVTVLYGGMSGLSGSGSQLLTQDLPGLRGEVFGGERFGGTMAAGDFDGDDVDDLAIGAENENADGETVDNAGAVNVLYGSGAGLTADGDELLQQGSKRVRGKPRTFEFFGRALAAGDAQRDGFDDLAVGVPGEHGGLSGTGAVHFFSGSGKGLLPPRDRLITEDTKGVPSKAKPDEEFGSPLALGDFTGDKRADLAIGVTAETLKGVAGDDHGVVIVLRGARGGITTKGARLWSQATQGVEGDPADNDGFGGALGAGDFDGDFALDLAIEVGDDPGGAVSVLYSRSRGLSANGDDLFSQDSAGISGIAESQDGFGSALAPP
jgi:FG-GAP repeat